MTSDLEALLKDIEDMGCSCDLLYSYTCGIHTSMERLRAALPTLEAVLKPGNRLSVYFRKSDSKWTASLSFDQNPRVRTQALRATGDTLGEALKNLCKKREGTCRYCSDPITDYAQRLLNGELVHPWCHREATDGLG